MDYSKLFEDTYKQKFQELEIFVDGEFQSSKENEEDERDFLDTYNEVKSQLEEWKTQHFETSSLKTKMEIYKYFTNQNDKVSFPEFLFPGVLERKTKKLFLENHSEEDYSAFIKELAENKAYQDVIDIVNNYHKYFDLVYRDKKWKPIDLARYDQNYESAEYFLKLHKKIWPPSYQTEGKKDYTREIEQTRQQLESFTEEEKIFLLKLFFEKILTSRIGMDKTEFIKFSQVISGIEDLSIFYKKAQDVKSYTLFKKKYVKFSKLDKGYFFQTLINKLDAVGLQTMKIEINKLPKIKT